MQAGNAEAAPVASWCALDSASLERIAATECAVRPEIGWSFRLHLRIALDAVSDGIVSKCDDRLEIIPPVLPTIALALEHKAVGRLRHLLR